MRHVYEVLKEKEIAIEQLRREIDALRFVCQMLHSDDDSTPDTSESGGERSNVELEEKTGLLRRADEKEVSLARFRVRLDSAQRKSARNGNASVLLQFREAALSASSALLNRVRSWEGEPQRKTIRYLFERLGRSSAA